MGARPSDRTDTKFVRVHSHNDYVLSKRWATLSRDNVCCQSGVCERKRVETCRKIRLDQIGNVHWHFVNLGRVILFNITQDTDVIVL